MTTLVHLLAIAIATAIAVLIIYWLIRKYEPQLAKGVVIIFAVFGGLLTSVASIKTNSPPARAIGQAITWFCTNAFNSIEQQTGYSFSEAHTNEIHNLAMPANAQLAERIARRGAHQDGFHHFDSFTNRLAREGLDLENPVWIQTDGTVTVRSPSPGIPIEELSLYTTYSNITVYAPLQGSYGFLPGSRWPEFNVSRIWMAVTDRGNRVITWEGALRNRDPAQPVSFQAEFKRNGDIEYHYNPAQTNFTGIGLYRGGAAMSFDRLTVEPLNRFDGELSITNLSTFHFPLSTLKLSYIGDLGDGTGDTDDDGLTDWQEIKVYHTDPHIADTDCDGVGDGDEVQNGTDPLNADTNGDGIPDGSLPEAWSNNVLRATAETANFSVTLLEAIPEGGRASLRIGDLTVLLSEAGTYWFNLPTNIVNTFSFASHGCGGLLLDAAVVAASPTRGAPPDAPYHIEDADGVLGTGRRAESGVFSVFWPWFRLVPRDGIECLHGDETSRIFDVSAGPMPWGRVPQGSVTLSNLVPEDGGYKLSLDGDDFATGTLTIGGQWLAPAGMTAFAHIHKCRGWGLFNCGFCGLLESLRCAHDTDCEAVTTDDGDCTCPPLFILVNLDDDDGNGIEDRYDTAPAGEDDLEPFRPVGLGVTCCCEENGDDDDEPREGHVTAIPPCLRATKEGDPFFGGTVLGGESLLLEGIAVSSADSAISYSVTDGEGHTHSVTRRVIAANAIMHPDYDGDGTYTAADTAFAQAHGLGPGCWPLPPRATPFKIRVTYEIPTDCSLRAYLTGNAPARVLYGNATPTVENGDTYYTLPNGSGTCELSISSPGVNSFGVVHLVVTDADGYNHYLSSQCFSTVESIIEKPFYVARSNSGNRVRVRLNPALVGFAATWSISPVGTPYAKMYEWQAGGDPCASVANASEIWVDPGQYEVTHTITAQLDRYGLSDTAAFKSVSIYCKPVISERHDGKWVNPSMCVVNRSARFEIDVSANIASAITWEASPSAGLTLDNTHGKVVNVTPTQTGTWTLTANIAGYDGGMPSFQFDAVEETTTMVYAYILGTNGDYRTTAVEVTNLIAGVNEIYEQVGMKFCLAEPSFFDVEANTNWLVISGQTVLESAPLQICNIAQHPNGLEVYFVHGIDWNGVKGFNWFPGEQSVGIIVPAGVSTIVLAHEIGHSCGLEDIYHTAPPNSYPNQPQIVGNIRSAWLPEDWGSTSPTEHFYFDNSQQGVIETLLMLGTGTCRGDLSFGDIYGIWFRLVAGEKVYRTSMAPVGVSSNLNRNPRHAQPGN